MARTSPSLDTVFAALSDPTRRGILTALAGGSQPVSGLAQPFRMSLPGFIKHVRILEHAGLLERRKEGRVVKCSLSAGPMKEAIEWLETYRDFWDQQLDSLERYFETQKQQEKLQERQAWDPSRRSPRSPSYATSTPRRRKSGKRGPTRT